MRSSLSTQRSAESPHLITGPETQRLCRASPTLQHSHLGSAWARHTVHGLSGQHVRELINGELPQTVFTCTHHSFLHFCLYPFKFILIKVIHQLCIFIRSYQKQLMISLSLFFKIHLDPAR